MTIQLPADIYQVIAKFIDDPTTYLNFLLSSRSCYQKGKLLSAEKRKEFFEEIRCSATTGRGKNNSQRLKVFVYLKAPLYRTVENPFIWYRYYEDELYTKLIEEGTCAGWISRYAIPEGESTLYYDSHTIKRPYQAGKIDGMERHYYLDGTLKKERKYVKGERTGFVREYFPNGQLRYKLIHTENYYRNEYESYYPSGKVKERGLCSNSGERDDTFKKYREDGTLLSETTYMCGQKTFKTVYYPDGSSWTSDEGDWF